MDPNKTLLDLIINQKVVRDLLNTAVNKDATNGTSYEVLGEVRTNKVTQQFVNTYVLAHNTQLMGTRPGPSGFWIFHDSDNGLDKTGAAGTGNNQLDASDNHGIDGGNVAYCDGHANWVSRKRWRYEWNITRDANLTDPMPPP